MKTVRYSKQRELILSEVQHRFDHPTAEMVFQSLKNNHPELSLGTVYRNLHILCDLQQILKVDLGDGIDRFDGQLDNHTHFYCEKCKKIYDLPLDSTLYHALIHIPHQVNTVSIILKGTCENCQEA